MSWSRADETSASRSQDSPARTTTSTSSSQGGSASGFLERHFGRSRPRTSVSGQGGGPPRSQSYNHQPLSPSHSPSPELPTGSSSPQRQQQQRRSRLSRYSSSSSNLPLEQSAGSPGRSGGGGGFPLRFNQRSATAGDDNDHDRSVRRTYSGHSGTHIMSRTTSTGGSPSGATSGGVGNTAPSSGSGGALGRMFRRYSQGQHGINQGRTTAASAAEARLGSGPASSTNLRSQSRGDTATNAPASSATEAPSDAQIGSTRADATGSASDVATSTPAAAAVAVAASSGPSTSAGTSASATLPSPQAGVHRIRLVPHLEATRSLHFEPIERDLREGSPAVKIGRFTDRAPAAAAAPPPLALSQEVAMSLNPLAALSSTAAQPSSSPSTQPVVSGPGLRGGAVPSSAGGGGRIDSTRIAFKSKVVSRGHAELWCEPGGKFFIKDTKSSSGTFLNHIRMSSPNLESRPFAIKDGDILQLGVDYQGGTEEIYRCVKIRVELNRGWQREANQFNVNALRQLRALQGSPMPPVGSTPTKADAAIPATGSGLPTNRQTMNATDCCICLFSVTVCQALFIAPCSHVFHYKCIRPMLNLHHPGFSCPLCRTFADLEADVEQDEEWQQALAKEVDSVGITLPHEGSGQPMTDLPTPRAEQHAEGPPLLPETAPNQSSTPSVPSGLRQQIHPDRPTTAVASDFSQSAAGPFDHPADQTAAEIPDEDLQEIMQEDDGGRLTGRSVNRIEEDPEAEVADRSAPTDLARRGSQPISIRAGSRGGDGHPRSTNPFRQGVMQTPDGFQGFSPLETARTPVNQHVLSVLAEAPPPTSSAARMMTAQTSSAVGDASGMPSLGVSSTYLSGDPQQQQPGTQGSATQMERSNSGVSSIGVGFQTPGEGSSPDLRQGFVSNGAQPLDVPSEGAQLQLPPSTGAETRSSAGTAARASGHNGSGGDGSGSATSSGSRHGSPSTAGEETDIVSGLDRISAVDAPSTDGSAALLSSSSAGQNGSASKDKDKEGSVAESSEEGTEEGKGKPGGKVKMFFKKAAGA